MSKARVNSLTCFYNELSLWYNKIVHLSLNQLFHQFPNTKNQNNRMTKKMKDNFSQIVIMLSFLLIEIFSLSLSQKTCAAEMYRYIEKTGTHTTFFDWHLDIDKEQMISITSQEANALFVNLCDESGATHNWLMKKENETISAQREENELHIYGTRGNETINKFFLLGEVPWFQPLSYSLRNLLKSEPDETKIFWMIRPDELKPHKFQAARVGFEEITIGNNSFQTAKIKINPTGLLSYLWHAYYWFRLEDGLFLRYEGTHGPPGTPKTVISLSPQPTAYN